MPAKLALISLFLLITTSLSQTSQQPSDNTGVQIEAFAKGFLNAIGSSSTYTQIFLCLRAPAYVITDLTNGLNDMKTQATAYIQEGIELIGEAANVIPYAYEVCVSAQGKEYKPLQDLVGLFKNPSSFSYTAGESIEINGVNVYSEITSAVEAFDQKDWNGVGTWVGKAMSAIQSGNSTVEF